MFEIVGETVYKGFDCWIVRYWTDKFDTYQPIIDGISEAEWFATVNPRTDSRKSKAFAKYMFHLRETRNKKEFSFNRNFIMKKSDWDTLRAEYFAEKFKEHLHLMPAGWDNFKVIGEDMRWSFSQRGHWEFLISQENSKKL